MAVGSIMAVGSFYGIHCLLMTVGSICGIHGLFMIMGSICGIPKSIYGSRVYLWL